MKNLFTLFTLMIISSINAAQPKPLTVVLDWFVNPQHAPIIIAQEKGFFKQQGLQVNIIAPADPADPPKLVAAGKADIAIGYQPELYLQVQAGLPIVRIGTLINTPMRAIAVLKSSNIHSISDLKNKTVAYSLSGVGTAILNTMLKYHNVDPNSVKLVNVHYNLVQALLSKRVDAITGISRNFEIPELNLAGAPTRVFYPENNGVPRFDALIFLANKNNVQDLRLIQFLKAVQEGVNYIHSHPLKSWQLMIKHHPELNNTLNKKAWELTLPHLDTHPMALNKKQYINFRHWMVKNKLLKQNLPLKHYAVDLRLRG
jgi:putative hydroxymethylpyrimidine transport system substrate-binding protein